MGPELAAPVAALDRRPSRALPGWLVGERGLAERDGAPLREAGAPVPGARVTRSDELDVAGLDRREVSAFLLAECARVSARLGQGPRAGCGRCCGSCIVRGPDAAAAGARRCRRWRAGASPASRRRVRRPRSQRLLASCDRRTRRRCATYAMLMLLARLGLRSVEVAAWSWTTSTGAPASSWSAARAAAGPAAAARRRRRGAGRLAARAAGRARTRQCS